MPPLTLHSHRARCPLAVCNITDAACGAALLDPAAAQELLRAAFADADAFVTATVPPHLPHGTDQPLFAATRSGVIWHRYVPSAHTDRGSHSNTASSPTRLPEHTR